MKKLIFIILILSSIASAALAQTSYIKKVGPTTRINTNEQQRQQIAKIADGVTSSLANSNEIKKLITDTNTLIAGQMDLQQALVKQQQQIIKQQQEMIDLLSQQVENSKTEKSLAE